MQKTLMTILLCAVSLSAKQYDFDTVLAKTLQNSYKLKNQKLSVEISKEDLKALRSSEFGEINLKEDFHRSNHAGMVFGDKLSSKEVVNNDFLVSNLNAPSPRNNFDTAIEYSAPLFAGFKFYNLKNAAKNRLSAEESLLKLDEKGVTLELLRAYNAAVSASTFVEAAKKANESAMSIHKNMTLAYKQKVVATIELRESEYHLAKSESTLVDAQKNAKVALAYLSYLSGLSDIDGVGDLKSIGIKDNAMQNRDDIIANEFYAKGSVDYLNAQKSAYLPQVVAFAKYGFNDDTLSFSANKDYFVAGVGLNWKLFDMGMTSAKVESARASKQKSELALQNSKDYARFEITKESLNLESKKKELELATKAAQLAEDIRQKYSLMRKNGLTPLSELLKREAESFMANAQLINAKTEVVSATAQLKMALGQNIFE